MDMYRKLYRYLVSQIDEALFFLEAEDSRQAEYARKILLNALQEVQAHTTGEEE